MAIYNQISTNSRDLYQEALIAYRDNFEYVKGMFKGLAADSGFEDITLFAAYLGDGEFLFAEATQKDRISSVLQRLKNQIRTASPDSQVPILSITREMIEKSEKPSIGTLTFRDRKPEQSISQRV